MHACVWAHALMCMCKCYLFKVSLLCSLCFLSCCTCFPSHYSHLRTFCPQSSPSLWGYHISSFIFIINKNAIWDFWTISSVLLSYCFQYAHSQNQGVVLIRLHVTCSTLDADKPQKMPHTEIWKFKPLTEIWTPTLASVAGVRWESRCTNPYNMCHPQTCSQMHIRNQGTINPSCYQFQ